MQKLDSYRVFVGARILGRNLSREQALEMATGAMVENLDRIKAMEVDVIVERAYNVDGLILHGQEYINPWFLLQEDEES